MGNKKECTAIIIAALFAAVLAAIGIIVGMEARVSDVNEKLEGARQYYRDRGGYAAWPPKREFVERE